MENIEMKKPPINVRKRQDQPSISEKRDDRRNSNSIIDFRSDLYISSALQNYEGATGRELFPIRTVSSLTGVKSITLRAWERRYGLVRPLRTPSGHRLYRRDEIDLIHRVVALLGKGIPISQVRHALVDPGQPDPAVRPTEDRPWTGLRRRMLAAIARLDDEALDEIYHEAFAVASAQQITHQLLAPLLEELEHRRRSADGSLAEERFFSVYLHHKLGARFRHRPRNLAGPRLLGACLPGETQDVGLLLFALTTQETGARWTLLGADVPPNVLTTLVARKRFDAIVLHGTIEATGSLTEKLRWLTTGVSTPVFVQGPVSIYRRDEIVAAGAVALGSDLAAGAKRIDETLDVTEPRQA